MHLAAPRSASKRCLLFRATRNSLQMIRSEEALSLFCRAELSVPTLSELLEVNNKEEAMTVLAEIFKDLKKAEKLAKARELVALLRRTSRYSHSLKTC